MLAAFTTAAIINHSLYRPADPVQPKDFMPNYTAPTAPQPKADPIAEDELADYRSKRAHFSALLKRFKATGKADPYLIKIGLVGNG
jgi:hypothetical protein